MYDLTLASGLARHLVTTARPVEAHLLALVTAAPASRAVRGRHDLSVVRPRRIPAIAHTTAFAAAR